MPKLLILFFVSWIPTLELRASIPLGILGYKLPWLEVFALCVMANALLALPLWVALQTAVDLARRVGWIDRLWERVVERARRKIHPYVERWGTLGLALFIAVPLPGSGVYTGLLGAYVLGVDTRRAMVAACLGVLLAGVAVTAVTLTGGSAVEWMINAKLME